MSVLTKTALLSVLLCSILSARVIASEANELIRKAESQGQVRVILTFRDQQGFARNTGANTAYSEASKTKLLARQNAILSNLESASASHKLKQRSVKQFRHVPQMALSVSRDELEGLLADSSISVQEDTLRKPMLLESVSRVYPARENSPFHGNNQWVVAVLDSGVDKNHSFLSGKVVSEACYSDGGGQPGATSLCPGSALSSVSSGSGAACSPSLADCDHGTHVAGIAVGDGVNFDGVARDGKLISVQVYSRIDDIDFCFPDTSCIGAFASDIIAGLQRVYDLRNSFDIAAVSLSLGSGAFTGTCDNQPEKPIIDLLKSVKIATVAASGNDGSNSQIASPACISSAVAVGSTSDSSDQRSTFSNVSVALDLYAPGQSIRSSVPGGGFAVKQGTSLAVPHVAGAMAVLRHKLPSASVNQLENLLKSHGPLIAAGGVSRRRIDVCAALNSLSPIQQIACTSQADSSFIPAILMLLLSDD